MIHTLQKLQGKYRVGLVGAGFTTIAVFEGKASALALVNYLNGGAKPSDRIMSLALDFNMDDCDPFFKKGQI